VVSVVAVWVGVRYHTSDEALEQAQTALALSLDVSYNDDLPRAVATREHRRALVGMCHLWRGELDEAREHLQRAVQESERMGCLADLLVGLT